MPLSLQSKEPEIAFTWLSKNRSSGYQDPGLQLESSSRRPAAQGTTLEALQRPAHPRASAVCQDRFGRLVQWLDFLNPVPAELFNDAEWTPKMCAVAVTLSNEEILNNAGRKPAHGCDGIAHPGGRSRTGRRSRPVAARQRHALQRQGTRRLAARGPTVVNSGIYGGIDRANAVWRTRHSMRIRSQRISAHRSTQRPSARCSTASRRSALATGSRPTCC